MAIINPLSVVYLVISGEHKGRSCVIRSESNNKKLTGVIFNDSDGNRMAVIQKGRLAQLEIPGWPEKIHERSYDLREYRRGQQGNGTNMLRTTNLAQPWTLKPNDVLATGDTVVEIPRRGFNSSTLIRLDQIGWIELAPRLPIALWGNKKFRLPMDLRKNDKLATGCLIAEKSASEEVNWTTIFLDRKSCSIEVPSCVPLALS
jgi:hypothetical protein